MAQPYLTTVLGDRPASSMKLILPHEHILVDFGGADTANPSRYDAEAVYQKALPQLKQARALGVECVMECTPEYLGRDVRLMRRLSQASGMQIIVPTGMYAASNYKFIPKWAYEASVEQLATRWITEYREEIEGSGIKPGFIKIGVNPQIADMERKLVRAAAQAHRQTGLTIASHTGGGSAIEQQLTILREEGVHPSALVWVHANGEPDFERLVRVARSGCWVEFDGLSEASLEQHLQLVLQMKKAGLLHRVLISHDAGWYAVGEPDGGNWRPFTLLSEKFLPALAGAGLSSSELRWLTQTNPVRAFTVGVRKGS
ncbi:MAG: phosphotriesterase family protein [Thiobacillus sp.]